MLNRLLLGFSTLSLLCIGILSVPAGEAYNYEGETPGTLTAIGNAGSDQLFTFERWHFAALSMPADDPTQLTALIEIDITSVVTAWKDLEENVKKKRDYFFVRKFPKASVRISGAAATDDGKYTTEALLTLKGVERPVMLTFEISEQAPYTVVGSGLIQRRDFRFTGNGPKDEVPIAFSCVLPL